MPMTRLRSRLRASLPWLLCLALLLAMAQSAALWHGVAHGLAAAAVAHDEQPAPQASHCDLCLAAAQLGSGAAAALPPGVPRSLARHALPRPTLARSWLAPPALAYRSRAPPLASR